MPCLPPATLVGALPRVRLAIRITAATLALFATVCQAETPSDSSPAVAPEPAAGAPTQAVSEEPPTPALVFRGNDAAHCRSFLVVEAGAMADLSSRYETQSIFVADVGWMKNVGPSTALGATLFGESGDDRKLAGVRFRYRRWLGGRCALDLAPGLVLVNDRSVYRTPGLIGAVGLSAGDLVVVTVEAELVRTKWSTWYSNGSTDTSFRAGVKGGSYVGVALGVLGAIAAAAVSSIEPWY